MFISKERFAINKMDSLREIFNSFNTFSGILEDREDLLVFSILISLYTSSLVDESKKNESWFGCGR